MSNEQPTTDKFPIFHAIINGGSLKCCYLFSLPLTHHSPLPMMHVVSWKSVMLGTLSGAWVRYDQWFFVVRSSFSLESWVISIILCLITSDIIHRLIRLCLLVKNKLLCSLPRMIIDRETMWISWKLIFHIRRTQQCWRQVVRNNVKISEAARWRWPVHNNGRGGSYVSMYETAPTLQCQRRLVYKNNVRSSLYATMLKKGQRNCNRYPWQRWWLHASGRRSHVLHSYKSLKIYNGLASW